MSSTVAEQPGWYRVPEDFKGSSGRSDLIFGSRRNSLRVLKGLANEDNEKPDQSAYELLNSDDRSIVDELLKRTQTVPSGNEDDVIRDILLKYPKYEKWTHVDHNGKGYVYPPEFNNLVAVVKEAWALERREGDAMRPPGNYERGEPMYNSDQQQEMIAEFFAEKHARSAPPRRAGVADEGKAA